MGMTIEESLNNLKNLQDDYQQFHDDVWQDPESYGIMAESLKVAIDTMHKYQKIEDLVNDCADESVDDTSCCARYIGLIEEIIYTEEQEDGND